MTQKHTQGPWVVISDGWVEGSDGDPICMINANGLKDSIFPEDIANARLIAAAPELLGALEGLRACIMETRGPDAHAACDAADAAIAKAKGETQ